MNLLKYKIYNFLHAVMVSPDDFEVKSLYANIIATTTLRLCCSPAI